jgi:hypothetical protein
MKNTVRSSTPKTAATLIATGANLLTGVIVGTDGTNNATVTVYDNTAASGSKLLEVVVVGSARSTPFLFNNPIKAENGLYLDISGTGASATVYFG